MHEQIIAHGGSAFVALAVVRLVRVNYIHDKVLVWQSKTYNIEKSGNRAWGQGHTGTLENMNNTYCLSIKCKGCN